MPNILWRAAELPRPTNKTRLDECLQHCVQTTSPTAGITPARSKFIMSENLLRQIDELKIKASFRGLTVCDARRYGDARRLETWQKLLSEYPAVTPAPVPQISTKPDYRQINWRQAIALFVGAIVLFLLLQPLYSRLLKLSPIRINIQFSVGTKP